MELNEAQKKELTKLARESAQVIMREVRISGERITYNADYPELFHKAYEYYLDMVNEEIKLIQHEVEDE